MLGAFGGAWQGGWGGGACVEWRRVGRGRWDEAGWGRVGWAEERIGCAGDTYPRPPPKGNFSTPTACIVSEPSFARAVFLGG